MLYILSKDDLKIKQVLQTTFHEVNMSIDLNGKGKFVVTEFPDAIEGDIIYDNELDYKGIVDTNGAIKESTSYSVNVMEIDNIFNRRIIINNEELISSVGVEDFVMQAIKDNFTESDDELLNIPYIVVNVETHTLVNAKVETEDGIYNLHTYLGNIRERYGIYLDYKIKDRQLIITILKKDMANLRVDATNEDIITYLENYKVDTISKITVLATETGARYDYFLLTDRTITTDKDDPNRVKGKVEIVKCKDDEEIYQAALDAFKSNSYQHNIALTIYKKSKIYNEKDFVVGRELTIKTKDNGIYNTFISAISKKSNSNIYKVTCGNMRVTLIEKLKGVIS